MFCKACSVINLTRKYLTRRSEAASRDAIGSVQGRAQVYYKDTLYAINIEVCILSFFLQHLPRGVFNNLGYDIGDIFKGN